MSVHPSVRYRDSGAIPPFRTLPAFALKQALREGYPAGHFRSDILAGVVVGVVALPLSMALVYDVDGPLFFGAAQRAMSALAVVGDRAKAVILSLEDVPDMDVTGLVALESALEQLDTQRTLIVLVGVRKQPRRLMRTAGIKARFTRLRFRPTLDVALATAEQWIQRRDNSSTRVRVVPPASAS